LAELEQRLDELGITPAELADHLPDAVALRTRQDKRLARSLAPTIQEAFGESVQRNPQQIAHAIFPILGPAIRKAIAETMAGFVNTLNRAIESSLSVRGLKWRIEAWRTGVPYAQIVIKHALVYRVEQVFLIHRDSGLPLAHVFAEDLETQDADLISGMLTAIRDFVQDSFGATDEGGGGLRTLSVGERTVLVEQGPKAVLAAVVSGQHPTTLLERLQATLETIHLHFGSALTDFDGDSAPFEAAHPLLEECLEKVLTTDRPSTRGGTPRVAWAVIAVVLVSVMALWIRASVRWNRAITALENEPGIVLVDVERGLFRGHLAGLHDPLATEPSQLLLQSGIDTSRVDVQWESFLSFDAPLVVARARRTLDAPESLQLEFVSDTLYATGSATFDWVHSAAQRITRIPGVAHLDLSRADLILPSVQANIKNQIEERRILFDVGSSILVPPAPDMIADIAAFYVDFMAAGGEAGYGVSLELIGRTDTTGSNETNQLLSQQRARRVLQELVAQGVPGTALTATGIGTSDPILSDDPQTKAAFNRSVSLIVTVTHGIRGGGREE
jgi:OOP family OmpA-OmpF porin